MTTTGSLEWEQRRNKAQTRATNSGAPFVPISEIRSLIATQLVPNGSKICH